MQSFSAPVSAADEADAEIIDAGIAGNTGELFSRLCAPARRYNSRDSVESETAQHQGAAIGDIETARPHG